MVAGVLFAAAFPEGASGQVTATHVPTGDKTSHHTATVNCQHLPSFPRFIAAYETVGCGGADARGWTKMLAMSFQHDFQLSLVMRGDGASDER